MVLQRLTKNLDARIKAKVVARCYKILLQRLVLLSPNTWWKYAARC